MSDNPFAKPAAGEPEYSQPVTATVKPNQAPGGVIVIAILCLILGLLGLLGSCANGAGLAFQGAIRSFFEDAPVSTDMEFQKLNMQATMSAPSMIPNLLLSLVNLVVAPMLIIGSIGVMRKKESSRNLLRLGLLLAIIFNAIRVFVSVGVQLFVYNRLGTLIDSYEGPGDKEEIQMMYEMTKVFGIAGAAIAAVFSLVLIGFYFWARGYLNKEHVIQYFASFAK